MANNKIQIKRSVANGVVTGLANGELAFTQASNTLWIGLPDGSGVASIGGVRYPGVLTANSELVANSTLGINRVLVSNLEATFVVANGSPGTATWALKSGGASGNIYWESVSAGGVVQVNTGIGLTGGPISTNGTISINANTGVIANSTGLFVNPILSLTAVTVSTNLISGAFVSNTTQVRITANSTVSATIAANTLTLTTALAPTSGGTGKLTMTSQAILVGNTTNGYNEVALGSSGSVLQSNGTALVYDVLDGGSF